MLPDSNITFKGADFRNVELYVIVKVLHQCRMKGFKYYLNIILRKSRDVVDRKDLVAIS